MDDVSQEERIELKEKGNKERPLRNAEASGVRRREQVMTMETEGQKETKNLKVSGENENVGPWNVACICQI